MSENESGNYTPTESAATAAERNATVTAYRLVTTKYGEKAVMVCQTDDGTEFDAWASPYQTSRLTGSAKKGKVTLPARVVEFVTKQGKTGYDLVAVNAP
jgi:hypothetical protein